MNMVLSFLGLLLGLVILFYSSELAVSKMISIAQIFGLSMFMIGFIVSAVGSDLPEIFNSITSAYLGHGAISIGDSFGSVLTQITLILGLIPFFCTFCRLVPSTFLIVGLSEVIIVAFSVWLSLDGNITRLDGIILILLWIMSSFVLRRFGDEKIIAEEGVLLSEPTEKMSKLVGYIILGFAGIGVGSYLVIDSVINISKAFGLSEYVVSFFILSLGTSMPELVVAISAIRKKHFELAIGDIVGSCIVDATLGIGLGPVFFPIVFDTSALLFTGIYAIVASFIVVSILSWRGVNDRTTGGIFILIYLISWIIPLLI
jgi:cation:H+ antiporter